MASTITVQKNDDATITVALSNPDGSAYDATGSTLTFTVQRSAGVTPIITKPITSFTSGGSQATISLSKTELDIDIRAWRYELVLVSAAGLRRSSGLNAFYVIT